MKILKKCLACCAWLAPAVVRPRPDGSADWMESRFGKLLVHGWLCMRARRPGREGILKARLFRWCAGLDRRFIDWLGIGVVEWFTSLPPNRWS